MVLIMWTSRSRCSGCPMTGSRARARRVRMRPGQMISHSMGLTSPQPRGKFCVVDDSGSDDYSPCGWVGATEIEIEIEIRDRDVEIKSR